MSHVPTSPSPTTPAPAPVFHRTDGVLGVRLVAYIIDIVVIGMLTLLAGMAVTFLGLITFGIGWALFPVLGIGTAMAYAAITLGGEKQATLGMRVCGVRGARADGGMVDGLTAAAHCLLFYVATFTIGLLILDVVIGMMRSDGRMGHDLLTGLVFVRN